MLGKLQSKGASGRHLELCLIMPSLRAVFDHADDRGAVEPLDDEAAHPTQSRQHRFPRIFKFTQ